MEQFADLRPGDHKNMTGEDADEVNYDPALIIQFRKWALLKQDIEESTREMNELRDYCIEQVARHGYRDHKGSQFIELPFAIGGQEYRRIKRERRVSPRVDPEVAELICRAKGIYETCFPSVPTLDPDELYVQYQKGVLTQEDMDNIFTMVESFSFKPSS